VTLEAALPSSDALTRREAEVLAALLDGCTTNAQIAALLVIGETTVHYHLNSLMRKFGVINRTALAVGAMRAGVVVENRWVRADAA
jgi:DNA-binding CsgD family transcriptional regulator